MSEQLKQLLTRLKSDRAISIGVEEAVRQGVVLPILARLGWDRDNIREVVPEYTVGTGRVDYCLKIGEQISVFIEVKRTKEELEKHQEQLLEYAFRHGVKIAVLTNGLLWWFYLPLFTGSWDQRKFFTVDIQEQEVGNAANHFLLFLSRDAIASGTALKKAEEIHGDRQNILRISQTIPTAWRDLCQNPDEMLIELLAEKVESLCGLKPGEDVLCEFLSRTMQPELLKDHSDHKNTVRQAFKPPRMTEQPHPGDEKSWTFKTPTAFFFKGQRYQVGAFKEILMTLSTLLQRERGMDFNKVFDLRGRRRAYFGLDYKEMTAPQEIPGTGIYVDTCLSANAVRDRCNDLLAILGYQPGDLQVEFR